MWEPDTEMTDKLLSVIYRIDAKSLDAINLEIFDAICDNMKRQVAVEQLQWNRRNIALNRLGYSPQESEKQRRYYKSKKPKWMRRKLTDADRAALASAWH